MQLFGLSKLVSFHRKTTKMADYSDIRIKDWLDRQQSLIFAIAGQQNSLILND